MPAPTGNSNAFKWTLEKTEKLISSIETYIDEENVICLTQAMAMERTSTKQWNRLRHYYAQHDELMERMDAIEEIFEARLTVGYLTGRFQAGAARLLLSNKYGYKSEKQLAQRDKPAPPPDLLPELVHIQEDTDSGLLTLHSRHSTGLDYVIRNLDEEEILRGPIYCPTQLIDISSLPTDDYTILIRGPIDTNEKMFDVKRE